MKKTAKKIAMILILVLICNMFTGCAGSGMYVLIGVGALLLIAGIYALAEFVVDSISDGIRSIGRRSSIGAAFDSVPIRELNSFYARIDAMSEAEWVYALSAVNSFSAQELSVIVETFNSMSEEEIASSIKEINSLPKNVSLARIIRDIEVDFSEEEPYVIGWR